MSFEIIDQKISYKALKKKVNKKVFSEINKKIRETKFYDIKKKNENFEIDYDFLKSKDINKIKICCFSAFWMLRNLLDNFLSRKKENPFLEIFENFGNYVKKKIKILKNENREIKKVNKIFKMKLDFSKPVMLKLQNFILNFPKNSEMKNFLKNSKNNINEYNNRILKTNLFSEKNFDEKLKNSILKIEKVFTNQINNFENFQNSENLKKKKN